MFFLLSKILDFLITPVVWVGICLILAWICKDKRRKFWLITGFVILFVFGNSFLIDEAFRKYEVPAQIIPENQHYDYAIVLSGMMVWDQEFQRPNFHGNIDRLLQALPPFHKGQIDTLILSGGDGSALQEEAKESDILLHYLKSIGFPTDKIITESESRNTFENAAFTIEKLKQLNRNLKGKKILLITSALHMRRSLACFEKAGLSCEVYVTNRTAGPRKFKPNHLLVPNAEALHSWRALLHEWIGFVTYKLMGYI